MTRLNRQAVSGLARLLLMEFGLLFLPAWTFDYWQAWLFLVASFVPTVAVSAYVMKYDPQLLARRLRGGPRAEKEKSQRIIMTVAVVGFVGLLVVPGVDHRFNWSAVPPPIVLCGDLLVMLGYLMVFFVYRENSFASATIEVSAGQRVIATGPYARVRHPMYLGGLVMLLGIPLALGSWWGLVVFVPVTASIVWRLLDEEKFLAEKLAGYSDYRSRVKYRLLPRIW